MEGDRLASGAHSARFPVKTPHSEINVPKHRPVFGLCHDCDFIAYSALEFSDHIRLCPVNPVTWPAPAAA